MLIGLPRCDYCGQIRPCGCPKLGSAPGFASQKPAEKLVFDILEAVGEVAKREFEEMKRIPWYFFWKKGDAIARVKAWNDAWWLVLEKIRETDPSE